MTEKVKKARPPEIVWVVLYSVLVLMLMMFWVDVPARQADPVGVPQVERAK